MKQLVKNLMYRVAPELSTSFFSARARKFSQKMVRLWGGQEISRKLTDHFGYQVLSGPFQGMTLTSETLVEQIGPYLLGVYESELIDWISKFQSQNFSTIIDIGAKFGYYSVGFARSSPATPVVAFDTDPWARTVMKKMAAVNAVSNLQILGYCSKDWLVANLKENSLIISDCEGFESVLFTGTTDAFRRTTLLIETHEHEVPGVTEAIRNAFANTHDCETRDSRDTFDVPFDLSFLSREQVRLASCEVRPPQTWLMLTPKN